MPARSTTPDLNKQISHAPRSQNTKTLPDRCILSLSSTRESHPGGRGDKDPFFSFVPARTKAIMGRHPTHHPRRAEKKSVLGSVERTKEREVKVAHMHDDGGAMLGCEPQAGRAKSAEGDDALDSPSGLSKYPQSGSPTATAATVKQTKPSVATVVE
jgi:hypothetical protein